MNYRLRRRGKPDLMFEGENIADVSSREPEKTRWTEIRIYRTLSGKYVTEVVGMSLDPDERDLPTVHVAQDGSEVAGTLNPSRLGQRALNMAAANDKNIVVPEGV